MVRLKIFAVLPWLALLGGCVTTSGVGSVVGGGCKIVHSPKYAVRGRTDYDQVWINQTTEAIVTGCKQARPLARPASLDAPPPVAKPALVVKAKPKGRLRRWLGA